MSRTSLIPKKAAKRGRGEAKIKQPFRSLVGCAIVLLLSFGELWEDILQSSYISAETVFLEPRRKGVTWLSDHQL